MSSELKATRKKRSTAQIDGEPHIDHRKRPRNRTTQSCLNCHTSKRMCDRKKPCGRCVQLGITGLCVYEVDNPSHRADTQDDGSRLRQRVAELEGVIRQMKNKPHPRWVRSSGSGELDDKDKSQQSSSKSSSPGPSERRSSEPMEGASATISLSPSLEPSFSLMQPSHTPRTSVGNTSCSPRSPLSSFNTPSSFGSSSPALATPPNEFSSSFAAVASDQTFSPDFDFTTLFMGYPDLLASYEEGVQHAPMHQASPCMPGQSGEHCGCLTESSSYQAVLELSIRLRKAADSLKRSPYHQMESTCMLNQHIAKLDAYAASALGNMQYPIESSSLSSSPSISRPTSSYSAVAPAFPRHHRPSFSNPANGGQAHHTGTTQPIQPQAMQYDDSFMAWRGPTA